MQKRRLLLSYLLELPLPMLLPEVLLPELPTLGELLLPAPEVPLLELVAARSAATQSSNATPVIPKQREGVEDEADGPLSDVPEAEDELGLEGLVALGEVVLPVEPEPADPDTEEPGLALEEPEALPALPVCASTTPLAKALAASTASAFRGKCFIEFSIVKRRGKRRCANPARKRRATKRAFRIKRLRACRRAHCRADAALQSEQ